MRHGPANETAEDSGSWDLEIKPHTRWWDLQLREVWRYRDLVALFVRRDFISIYKQTVLGPVWFFVQPLLTTLVFTVIFSGIAGIPTDGHPAMLFYLAGTTPWNYFAACLSRTSNTFTQNAGLFGKVYFPRLVAPISVVASTLVQFAIQFLLFLALWGYHLAAGTPLSPQFGLILLLGPLLLLLLGLLGMGAGIVISSLTTKYRDFIFLVSFGVQLAMYATPVIYPASAVPERYQWVVSLNPMASVIETFRAVFLGGPVPWHALGVSAAVTLALLTAGLLLFNRVEKTFMDTV